MAMNKQQVKFIQDRGNERITEILDSLGVEYKESINYLKGPCPIHKGDNNGAFYWAIRTNHWKCKTKSCHENPITGKSTSLFGLVRGILSEKFQKQIEFKDSVLYIARLLNINTDNYVFDKEEIEIDNAITAYKKRIKNLNNTSGIPLINISQLLKSDNIYYITRGVSKEIISKYHISYCDDKRKIFYQRAFFPTLDETGKYIVGWSGRSIWQQCENCRLYHSKELSCASIKNDVKHVKWRHSNGFKAGNFLYNYWFAKHFINRLSLAIICEGPGNCWAYEQSEIKNSVALFGLGISKTQIKLLQKAGALTLMFVLDNDEAGRSAKERLKEQLLNYFRLIFVDPLNANDVADMLPKDIKERFQPFIEKYSWRNHGT